MPVLQKPIGKVLGKSASGKIKEREREKLLSDEGLKYRSRRPQDVEAVEPQEQQALQEVPSSWI